MVAHHNNVVSMEMKIKKDHKHLKCLVVMEVEDRFHLNIHMIVLLMVVDVIEKILIAEIVTGIREVDAVEEVCEVVMDHGDLQDIMVALLALVIVMMTSDLIVVVLHLMRVVDLIVEDSTEVVLVMALGHVVI